MAGANLSGGEIEASGDDSNDDSSSSNSDGGDGGEIKASADHSNDDLSGSKADGRDGGVEGLATDAKDDGLHSPASSTSVDEAAFLQVCESILTASSKLCEFIDEMEAKIRGLKARIAGVEREGETIPGLGDLPIRICDLEWRISDLEELEFEIFDLDHMTSGLESRILNLRMDLDDAILELDRRIDDIEDVKFKSSIAGASHEAKIDQLGFRISWLEILAAEFSDLEAKIISLEEKLEAEGEKESTEQQAKIDGHSST